MRQYDIHPDCRRTQHGAGGISRAGFDWPGEDYSCGMDDPRPDDLIQRTRRRRAATLGALHSHGLAGHYLPDDRNQRCHRTRQAPRITQPVTLPWRKALYPSRRTCK
jgi:hypothetical protein